MSSYLLVVFFSPQFREHEWDFDEALATWQVLAGLEELSGLRARLDELAAAGAIDYHLEALASPPPARVEDVLAALGR